MLYLRCKMLIKSNYMIINHLQVSPTPSTKAGDFKPVWVEVPELVLNLEIKPYNTIKNIVDNEDKT